VEEKKRGGSCRRFPPEENFSCAAARGCSTPCESVSPLVT